MTTASLLTTAGARLLTIAIGAAAVPAVALRNPARAQAHRYNGTAPWTG
jgi:hypothetical protein